MQHATFMDGIKPITGLSEDQLKGVRVLVRVDFNVPVYNGKILDDLRIRKTLRTIAYLRSKGAKIILISHIESKDGTGLLPVAEYINEKYHEVCGQVFFISDFLNDTARNFCNAMKEGDVVLFENLRVSSGEKENSAEFSKYLAHFGDLYVNEAFAVSHRVHASVVGVPALFKGARYAGIQLVSELENLKIAFNPPHPFLFILGGAKFESKLPLIQKFSKNADAVYLGGALLNDVLRVKGLPVGKSLVYTGEVDLREVVQNPKLVIPDDVVVEESSGSKKTVKITDVSEGDAIMDVGPSLVDKLKHDLKTAQFVLWNGPMGNYEKGYKEQTLSMAEAVFSARVSTALGGGDTTAAIAELGYDSEEGSERHSKIFISTGGGAMLEYLENETLPGVEALKN
jgi:phosphoglycerate kinase